MKNEQTNNKHNHPKNIFISFHSLHEVFPNAKDLQIQFYPIKLAKCSALMKGNFLEHTIILHNAMTLDWDTSIYTTQGHVHNRPKPNQMVCRHL